MSRCRVECQREIVTSKNRVSAKAVEMFHNFEMIKLFATESRECAEYNQLHKELQVASEKVCTSCLRYLTSCRLKIMSHLTKLNTYSSLGKIACLLVFVCSKLNHGDWRARWHGDFGL
jgi:ABC-type transport system involved in Fe-S cluster assembly fused permease/ATPase subunit